MKLGKGFIGAALLIFACFPWALVAAPVCETSPPPLPPAWGVGLGVSQMLPSRLPDFAAALPAYGAFFSAPIGKHTLRTGLNYGSALGFYLYLAELSFEYNFDTPYLPWFFTAGIHYLHYDAGPTPHDFGGFHAGPGLKLSMGRSMEFELTMKLYVQKQLLTSFTGGLTLRL